MTRPKQRRKHAEKGSGSVGLPRLCSRNAIPCFLAHSTSRWPAVPQEHHARGFNHNSVYPGLHRSIFIPDISVPNARVQPSSSIFRVTVSCCNCKTEACCIDYSAECRRTAIGGLVSPSPRMSKIRILRRASVHRQRVSNPDCRCRRGTTDSANG